MKSTVEQLPKSSVKLTITIAPEDMKEYVAKATERLGSQIDVKGFRKGKVPAKVVESKVGKDQLAHETFELAVADAYYKAIQEHKLRPIGQPQTDLKHEHVDLEQTGISFTATVPVVPDVKLGDYQKVTVEAVKSAFSEKQVDETIEQLRNSRASFAQVARAAKDGDRVEIDFVGSIDGKEFEGGKSENHPLVIGDQTFIPGFEENLIGMKAGDKKKFTVKFPKDYRQTDLAGKDAEFAVTLKQVQERALPKLDDEFAASLGAKSMDDLRKRLSENLKQEKDTEAGRETEMKLLEAIIAGATVEVPEALVEEELNGMMAELKQQIERQGLPYDKYLEQLGKKEADLRQEYREEAEKRVTMSLVLNTLQATENIMPTDEQVKAEVAKQLEAVTEPDDKERIKSDEFQQYVRRVLGNRMTIDKLMQSAMSK
ncbi:trigger factor [Patescibacteria group bacterium]|nr:trigger factor [Patescibacteria group bacterium]